MIATKLRLIAQKALGNEADTAEAKEILHTFNISVDFRDFRFERCKKSLTSVLISRFYQRKIKYKFYYDL